jgi:hypothetical protein
MTPASCIEQWCCEFEKIFAPISTIRSSYTAVLDPDRIHSSQVTGGYPQVYSVKCIDDICKGSRKMTYILDQIIRYCQTRTTEVLQAARRELRSEASIQSQPTSDFAGPSHSSGARPRLSLPSSYLTNIVHSRPSSEQSTASSSKVRRHSERRSVRVEYL